MSHPDTLTAANVDTPHERDALLNIADRAVVRGEFVIAYEAPRDTYHGQTSDRGYLTIWVRNTDNRFYERVQMLSGDDSMTRTYLGECASHGVERIERLIGEKEAPQP